MRMTRLLLFRLIEVLLSFGFQFEDTNDFLVRIRPVHVTRVAQKLLHQPDNVIDVLVGIQVFELAHVNYPFRHFFHAGVALADEGLGQFSAGFGYDLWREDAHRDLNGRVSQHANRPVNELSAESPVATFYHDVQFVGILRRGRFFDQISVQRVQVKIGVVLTVYLDDRFIQAVVEADALESCRFGFKLQKFSAFGVLLGVEALRTGNPDAQRTERRVNAPPDFSRQWQGFQKVPSEDGRSLSVRVSGPLVRYFGKLLELAEILGVVGVDQVV